MDGAKFRLFYTYFTQILAVLLQIHLVSHTFHTITTKISTHTTISYKITPRFHDYCTIFHDSYTNVTNSLQSNTNLL